MDSTAINIYNIIELFVVAFVVTAVFTPLTMRIAPKIHAMDVPNDSRRMHTRTIPRFGGIAIVLGCVVSMILFGEITGQIRIAIFGGLSMYLLGLVDDIHRLGAWTKLIVQLVVAIAMYALGIRVYYITDYFNYFGGNLWVFGSVLCFVVTVLWIVGITNTINLIDGLDGLAAGITTIVSLCIAYIAYIHGTLNGMFTVCMAFVAIAGACAGFLPWNFSPAKTFMGDGGSLFLGFMIAVLSIISPLKRATFVAMIVPIVTLGIPIFDTFYAILRRMIHRQPIMKPDKGHLHHRLVASGHGQRRTVIMLYGITGIMGMAAVLISRELYKDAFFLVCIVGSYLYVFLTDSGNQLVTKRKNSDLKTNNTGDLDNNGESDK